MKIVPKPTAMAVSACLLFSFLAGFSNQALALDVGFEFSTRAGASDNLFQDNVGEEESGNLLQGDAVVFGQHLSSAVEAGFLGEFTTRSRNSNDSDTETTVTRFFGSLEFNLTRSFSWFFGDVLGGSRDDDVAASIDDTTLLENRRNVLITGPVLDWEIDSVRNLDGHLFFIDNSDDTGTEFADLVELELEYEQRLQAGWTWGLALDSLLSSAASNSSEPDFTRTTFGITGSRSRTLSRWSGFLGGTLFQSDGTPEFETSGFVASLRYERDISEFSNFFIDVNNSIVDQTLNETEDLLGSGIADSPEDPGIFNDTLLSAGYKFETEGFSIALEVGGGISDFDALFTDGAFVDVVGDEADQTRYFARFDIFRSLTPRLSVTAALSNQREDTDITDEFTEGTFAELGLRYKISTSFLFAASYLHEIQESDDGEGVLANITDSNENRVFLSLTFAPPTRATKDRGERLTSIDF